MFKLIFEAYLLVFVCELFILLIKALSKREISPMKFNLTLFLIKSGVCSLIASKKSFRRAFTSFFSLPQFSVLKAKRVKFFILFSKKNSTANRAFLTPSLWPSFLSKLLFSAHLVFPSIIMATWFGSFLMAYLEI